MFTNSKYNCKISFITGQNIPTTHRHKKGNRDINNENLLHPPRENSNIWNEEKDRKNESWFSVMFFCNHDFLCFEPKCEARLFFRALLHYQHENRNANINQWKSPKQINLKPRCQSFSIMCPRSYPLIEIITKRYKLYCKMIKCSLLWT